MARKDNNEMAGAGQTTHTFTGNPENYNHDFNAQIGDYSGKANEQYNRYNDEYNNAKNYENQYNDAFANRQDYGDLMNQAEEKYNVGNRQQAYEDSARAVAATQQAMLALPSTTNRNSNVVLTQAQRNAALGNQMNKYNTTLASNVQNQAVAQTDFQNALQQAMNLAAGNYQSQQDALAAQMNQYQNAYNVANQAYANALNQENLLRDVYAKMYQDEYQHMQNDYQYWYGNLQDKWKQQEIAAQKYAADSAMRVQQFIQQKQDERDAAERAQAEADREARERAAAAAKANSNAKNTYATKYGPKNFGDWLSTGGFFGDIIEHGLNLLGGGNVGSYGRYGEGKGTTGSFW